MIARKANILFQDLYDLQRAGVVVDTRLILDDGELAIHWSLLDLYGHQWWTGLGEAGGDNVVILPGVSVPEAQQFVDVLYGRQNILSISNKHYTVIEDTGVNDANLCNNNSDFDVKLEPYEIYDQVSCDSCGKVFNNKKNLSDHIFNTHTLKDSTCDICGKSFKSRKALLSHRDVHKTFECESCGKCFKSSTYYKHRKSCQVYKCELCDFETTSKKDFCKHKKVHESNLKHCLFCTYTTQDSSNLKKHILNVHSDSKFSCNLCDKKFSRESSLSNHKEKSHSSKLKCDYCEKEYVCKKNLDKHILKDHTKNKIESSNGSFMLLHQTERIIQKRYHFCQQCDYKSRWKRDVARHVERKHRQPNGPKKDLNRTCVKCNTTFSRYSNFKAHFLKCKVKLKKTLEPKDFVGLMKTRDFNFRDISATNRLIRSFFGRNAVKANLIKSLNAAVEELKEYHGYKKVRLQRNVKVGKKKTVVEDFDTYATYVSNINDFTLMACEKLDVNPQDVKFLWSCDGGGGKTLITMDMFLPDGRHFTFIMLQADGAPENYFNKKLELAKYYKDSKMTDYISERSRNSK